MPESTQVQALLDKQAITELIYSYCRAVDRLDIPLGHSIWHEDGHADYGAGFYQGPGTGVIDAIIESHHNLASHSHQVANILIQLDGDRAGSESYVHGTMRVNNQGKTMQISVYGRYLDAWEKREGRWGIVRREVTFEHQDIREVTDMQPIGVPSTRGRDDPSYKYLASAE